MICPWLQLGCRVGTTHYQHTCTDFRALHQNLVYMSGNLPSTAKYKELSSQLLYSDRAGSVQKFHLPSLLQSFDEDSQPHQPPDSIAKPAQIHSRDILSKCDEGSVVNRNTKCIILRAKCAAPDA
uniref:Uncharacterized protein n=1 Tax=Eutreptiella gymnastica TaxID=73025 RepID=A0A7S4G5B3_9EUGL